MKLLSVLAGAAALALVDPSGEASAAPDTRLIEVNPDRAIEVTGEASVEAAPDFAKVTLGVTTTDKDAGKAMAANARATNALIAALKGEGLAPADIQTSSLSIAPNFANRSSASSEPPAIAGYTVGNMVTVTVRELSRLGALHRQGGRERGQRDQWRRLWREQRQRPARQGPPARLRRREAQGRDLRRRGRVEDRPADRAQRAGRRTAHALPAPRLCDRRDGGPDAGRGW